MTSNKRHIDTTTEGNPSPFDIDYELVFSILNKRKLTFSIIVLICLLLGFTAYKIVPSEFEATTYIKLEENKEGEPSNAAIASQKSILKNEDITLRVMKKLDIYDDYSSPNNIISTTDSKKSTPERKERKAITHYLKKLTVYNYPNSSVLKIQTKNNSAKVATNIANTHIEEYMLFDIERKTLKLTNSLKSLDTAIQQAQDELSFTKKSLIDFATKNGVGNLNLDVDDETLIEISPSNSKNTLSAAKEVKLDILKRKYRTSRKLLFSLKGEANKMKLAFSSEPTVATLLSKAKSAKKTFPKIPLFSLYSIILALVISCLVILYDLITIKRR